MNTNTLVRSPFDDVYFDTIERAAELFQEPSADAHEHAFNLLHRVEGKVLGRLMESAIKHPVSQLPNRFAFESKVEELLSNDSVNKGIPENVGACFLDIVGFKKVNDIFSHRIGDDALKTVGHVLGDSLRRKSRARVVQDLFAVEEIQLLSELKSQPDEEELEGRNYHLAGDEFTMLLADLDGMDTLLKATNRIILSVLRHPELKIFLKGIVSSMPRESSRGLPKERSLVLGLRAGAVLLSSCTEYEERERMLAAQNAWDPKTNKKVEYIAKYTSSGLAHLSMTYPEQHILYGQEQLPFESQNAEKHLEIVRTMPHDLQLKQDQLSLWS